MSRQNRQFTEDGRRKARPLDTQRLRDLALRYVARYATSTGKLRAYLLRKLREREWQDDTPPDVEALIGYFVERGFVDDQLYANQKAGDLTRRGFGKRRVDAMLYISGIADDDAAEARETADAAKWQAGLSYVRRKRFGPFARPDAPDVAEDRALKDRQIASMLRAGHDMQVAQTLISARDLASLREKGDEALDEALDGFMPPL